MELKVQITFLVCLLSRYCYLSILILKFHLRAFNNLIKKNFKIINNLNSFNNKQYEKLEEENASKEKAEGS